MKHLWKASNTLKKDLAIKTKQKEKKRAEDQMNIEQIKKSNWTINLQIFIILGLIAAIAFINFNK